MASVTLGRYRSGLRQYMDDTYIASLFPIITKDEFASSMARINLAYAPDLWMYVLRATTYSLVLLGFILFAVGAHLSVQQFGFNPLVIIGLLIFIAAGIASAVAQGYIVGIVRARLLGAIAVENAYYSCKVPPATFRLKETVVIWRNYNGGGGRRVSFNIVIDVGAQVVLPTLVNVQQTNNFYQPMSPAMQQQPQYAMGAVPMMQPSSPPRFAGGAVTPMPPMQQQQQQPYGQQWAQQPKQPQQYYQQQPMQQQPYGQAPQQSYPQQQQQQPQQPMYYNLPGMQEQQQQQPPAYAQNNAQSYSPRQQPFEQPVKPAQQQTV